MKKVFFCLLILAVFTFSSSIAHPHSGRTDSQGGHYNRKTGGYHYHNRPKNSNPTDTTPKQNELDQADEDNIKKVVYVTKTGSKYHRGTCHYLRYSKYPISKKKAIEQGYLPCKVCRP